MVCAFTATPRKHWVAATQANSYQMGPTRAEPPPAKAAGHGGHERENWRGGRRRARQDGQGSVSVTPLEWAIKSSTLQAQPPPPPLPCDSRTMRHF